MSVQLARAVLFDFDGVVADSAHAHHGAWAAAFEAIFDRPLGAFPRAELAGKAPLLIAAHLARLGGDEAQAQRLHDDKLALLLEGPPPTLLPGVRTFMKLLDRDKVPFGIASNAPGPFVRRSAALLRLPVKTVLGVEDFTRPKPAPDPYLQLAAQLGVAEADHSRTWILEDSLTGMHAAAATGMCAFGILTQYPEQALLDAGARRCYATPAGVAALYRALAYLG